jgi:phosphorylcholine metabolism protein LicD|tara:strand:- start:347 stop:997 length:651 start_codon:yes stop_codon:yes gene_type:complete
MKIDEQLLEVTEILNKNNIFYWIDSGTLLGIVREGKLLSGDLDIDISIPSTEKEKVLGLLPDFQSIGYFFKESWTYKLTDYIFKLESESKNRFIDFQIYYENKENNIWYSPQFVNRKSNNIISKVIRKIIHDYIIGRSKNKNTGKYPFAYDHITWVESKELIGIPKYMENTEIKAPENIIGILKLHYGSTWKVPNRNWNFIRDDGAFIRKNPDTFR